MARVIIKRAIAKRLGIMQDALLVQTHPSGSSSLEVTSLSGKKTGRMLFKEDEFASCATLPDNEETHTRDPGAGSPKT